MLPMALILIAFITGKSNVHTDLSQQFMKQNDLQGNTILPRPLILGYQGINAEIENALWIIKQTKCDTAGI